MNQMVEHLQTNFPAFIYVENGKLQLFQLIWYTLISFFCI